MDAKRTLLNAANATGNPDLARKTFLGILRLIDTALDEAQRDPDSAPTQVQFHIDPQILGNPLSTNVRNYLTTLGYTASANVQAGIVTISW